MIENQHLGVAHKSCHGRKIPEDTRRYFLILRHIHYTLSFTSVDSYGGDDDIEINIKRINPIIYICNIALNGLIYP